MFIIELDCYEKLVHLWHKINMLFDVDSDNLPFTETRWFLDEKLLGWICPKMLNRAGLGRSSSWWESSVLIIFLIIHFY